MRYFTLFHILVVANDLRQDGDQVLIKFSCLFQR